MGSLTAPPLALDVSTNSLLVLGAGVLIVLLCAGAGLNAWMRVRRIDSSELSPLPPPAGSEAPAAPGPAEPPAASADAAADAAEPVILPADDFSDDPDYLGPGDWDGGPLDPPEFRTPPA